MMEVVPQVARARTRCGLRAIKLDGYSRLPRRVGSSHPELRAGGAARLRKTYRDLGRETARLGLLGEGAPRRIEALVGRVAPCLVAESY